MILIVTKFAQDPTVVRLSEVLRAQGAEPLILSAETMETPSALSVANDGRGGGRSILRLNDAEIDLTTVESAMLWRSWQPLAMTQRFHAIAEKRHEWTFFEREWTTFHRGFLMTLAYSGVFCVNPPPFNSAFEEKSCQLLLAAQAGLTIPPTLYTARLAMAREFYDAQDGDIIYKPFRSHVRILESQQKGKIRTAKLYTSRVKAGDLTEPPGFLPTPGIFQPYIEKALELRIVVVGRQLFACAIHSQQSERSKEDWRRYDFQNTPYVPYDLPAEIAAKLLALMERMGLVFGSIDMILTPEGEYIFLEVNPNGQFDWIAKFTGLPIYEHLATLLRTRDVNYATAGIAEVAYAR